MKKYKLIKQYPNSPVLGTEVDLSKIHTDKICWYLPNGDLIDCKISVIRNNPEFWEEVIEKEYEILSFKSKTLGQISTHYSNGMVKWDTDDYPEFHHVSDILKKGEHDIYSIKRLSDGEVFTVGDKIQGTCSGDESIIGYVIIKEFKIERNSLRIYHTTGFRDIRNGWDKIKKYIPKTPLLITNDNVEVYYNQDIYSVNKEDFHIETRQWRSRDFEKGAFKVNPRHDREFFFSTKEKAEEYVINNKPCLSIKEVWDYAGIQNYQKLSLIDLVKSKLNK